ncbi:MAG TPA: serine/threonine-protein kinase [Thermoanaerobaculia bacterium]|nr:serine/threonine-protein kinase [Thermoanaerobaculia bacterium]
MPHQPGDVLDNKYEIVERLGAGGMGEVYKAVHTYLGSTRVIKVVHPNISANADARNRFLREARAATKVQHPNVATLHDFSGLPDGSHYMVWEFIDGENLAQRLRTRGTLPPSEAVRVTIEALRGLEAIHAAGIIHRDISPENLMITRETGAVTIIDLGVAKIEDPTEVASTATGIFVGKLRYAAPEQLGFLPEGEKIDARTDLYSVGMVLYELLMGRPPYEAKSPHEYFLLHAREEQQKKSIELPRDLPGGAALRQVLDRALARDRNQRFSSAREFAAALGAIDAAPLDGDTTMRVVPQAVPAATTVRTAIVPPAQRSSAAPLIVVIGLVLLVSLAGIGAVVFWPRKDAATTATTTTTVAEQPAQVAESSMSVVATETTATTATTAPPPVTITAAPAPSPAPVTTTAADAVAPATRTQKPKPEPEPEPVASEPEPEPEPEPSSPTAMTGPAYVDGGGDEVANERMIEQLRRDLAGVTRVELHGGAMQNELTRAMREHFPRLELADDAPVVIRFHGEMERLGRGRKRRAAVATVAKNGRIIFRYRLPNEVFRVGMHPPDAFARVLSDALMVE